MFKVWEEYDPTWLVEAAEKYKSEYPWLPSALAECIKAKRESKFYTAFVNQKNPNKPGSEWQFETNIILEETAEGEVVLDILQNNRVGGVEFLSKLCGSSNT